MKATKPVNSFRLTIANCRFPILLLFFLLFVITSPAQQITFCEKVDAKGKAIGASSKFAIDRKGGYINFLVTLPNAMGHNGVTYDIFRIDSIGKERYDNTVKQTVDPSVVIFSKQIEFYKPGTYRVYVYDSFDKFLCAGEVKVVVK